MPSFTLHSCIHLYGHTSNKHTYLVLAKGSGHDSDTAVCLELLILWGEGRGASDYMGVECEAEVKDECLPDGSSLGQGLFPEGVTQTET